MKFGSLYCRTVLCEKRIWSHLWSRVANEIAQQGKAERAYGIVGLYWSAESAIG